MCCEKSWTMIGAILAGAAVVLGAFAAHLLDGMLVDLYGDATKVVAGLTVPASWKYLQDFKTGAEYQMYHALALVAVGMLSSARPRKSLQIAAWCFVMGILLFSGSLYALVLTKQTMLGMVTPFGGVLFIAGWVAFAIGACSCGTNSQSIPVPLDVSVPLPMSDNRKETDPVVRS